MPTLALAEALFVIGQQLDDLRDQQERNTKRLEEFENRLIELQMKVVNIEVIDPVDVVSQTFKTVVKPL